MKKNTEKEYWMFTLINEYKSVKNLWFEGFPTKSVFDEARNKDFCGRYVILNMVKLTEEQYEKLTK